MTGIQAAILDWAGTVVDCGSLAPMGAFVRAFAELGVTIGVEDARGPMGMAKRDHIAAVLAVPQVAEAWRARHGSAPDHAAVERVFAVFEPMNAESVVEHAAMIPGASDALAALAVMGIRVGSTTGYTRPIMRRLMPVAAAAGYVPEVTVCAGDLPAGRPTPLMMWHAMAAMGVWPAWTVVKVDDTPVGIGEGRAAGTWTVGIAMTGNIVGLDAHDPRGVAGGRADAVAGARHGRVRGGRDRPGDRLDRRSAGRDPNAEPTDRGGPPARVEPMIVVRPFEDRDARGLTGLMAEMARGYGATIEPSRVVVAEVVRRARAVDVIVAAEGDALVGFVTFASLYPVAGLLSFTYVQQIYVTAKARRLGVARGLIGAVARAARARGDIRIEWSTAQDNVAARAFYDGLGAVGHEKVQYVLSGRELDQLADRVRP